MDTAEQRRQAATPDPSVLSGKHMTDPEVKINHLGCSLRMPYFKRNFQSTGFESNGFCCGDPGRDIDVVHPVPVDKKEIKPECCADRRTL